MNGSCHDCKDCPYVQNLDKDVTRLKNDIKDIYGKLTEVEKFTASSEKQFETITGVLSEIKNSIDKVVDKFEIFEKNAVSSETVKKLENQVAELMQKPAKRWDNLINNIISAIVGVMAGYFLKK